MKPRPLIVLTLEGLATSPLSCYGCSWNRCPAIDALAATGTVWDRLVATSDDPLDVLGDWICPDEACDWGTVWRGTGELGLVTDDSQLVQRDLNRNFGQTLLVKTDDIAAVPAAAIEDTRFGRLIAEAIDFDRGHDWSLLWLHSDFLTQCWDAPRESESAEFDSAPERDEWEDEVDGFSAEESDDEMAWQPLPSTFESTSPPALQTRPDQHPDLVTSWMRTYAAQVRLVDLLLEVLLGSLSKEAPQVLLAGTSGFAFGQSGWIGHRCGPLRSCDIRLPLVISDRGPIRCSQLTASDQVAHLLTQLATDPPSLVSPAQWCRDQEEYEGRVETRSTRAQLAVTTSGWSYVEDSDASEHLFLKPDDVGDANDVARLRDDVIRRLVNDSP